MIHPLRTQMQQIGRGALVMPGLCKGAGLGEREEIGDWSLLCRKSRKRGWGRGWDPPWGERMGLDPTAAWGTLELLLGVPRGSWGSLGLLWILRNSYGSLWAPMGKRGQNYSSNYCCKYVKHGKYEELHIKRIYYKIYLTDLQIDIIYCLLYIIYYILHTAINK